MTRIRIGAVCVCVGNKRKVSHISVDACVRVCVRCRGGDGVVWLCLRGVVGSISLAGLLYEPSQGVSELRQLKDLAIQQLQKCPETLPEILLLFLVLLQPLLCPRQLLLQHPAAQLCLLGNRSHCRKVCVMKG